jgi:Ca-activated chloride channel family protein
MRVKWGVAGGLVVLTVGVVVLVMGGPAPMQQAEAAIDRSTPGSLSVIVKPGEKLRSCPLEHTDVEGWIAGDVAHVRVTQRFANPYDDPIEAVYAFPLPENSAVNDMEMRIGERTIRGVIKERDEAKEIYEEAKRAGKTASLLEQERPNIFTQSVANIMPGEPVEITLWYVQDLPYDRGRYEFTFPMVVGPRYIPGHSLEGPHTGGGWAPDTDRVPGASRITPPVLRPGERTGHDISLTLHLDPGVPAHDVSSKSHDVAVDSYGDAPMIVSLPSHEMIPNKDFSLSWRVAGERPEVALLTHSDDRSGYFTLILQPKADFEPSEIAPKEMIFCLDTSGSMSGVPIEKSKEVVKLCLQEMGPHDTFQVIRFAGDSSTFAPEPVPASRRNVERAIDFIDELRGSGGTEMLKGIEASLGSPPDPKRVRIVAFLTDGYIGNESEILARIQRKLGEARIFSFGIGSSVNRYLLRKMAEMGRGVPQFVRQDEDPDAAVRSFVDRISRPYLTDVEIDWGGLDVRDTYPPYVPDLFADQPVVLHGRYEQPGAAAVAIRGRVSGEPWETTLQAILPADQSDNAALGVLWARACIEDMMDQMHEGEDPELVAAVTELAIAYRLASQYTSFVAVEEKVVNRGGQQVTVQVPVPIPEGVSYKGVFGDAALREESALAMAPPPAMAAGRAAAGMAGGRAGLTRVRAPAAKPRSVGGVPIATTPRMWDLDISGGVWIALVTGEANATSEETLGHLLTAARTAIGLPVGTAAILTYEQIEQLETTEDLQVLLLIGSESVTLSDKAKEVLVAYVESGGFVVIDSGSDDFHESIVPVFAPLTRTGHLATLGTDHEVFRDDSMPFVLSQGCPAGDESQRARPAEGLVVDGRLAVFVSRANLTGAWREPPDESTRNAYRMGVNLIAYGLQTAS